MVASILTQLALSGRSLRAHPTSDEPASDPESDSEVVDLARARGKNRIEIQLTDRGKEAVFGFVVVTSAPQVL